MGYADPYSFDSGTTPCPQNDVPLGGTTGQVLTKASDTDFDTEWTDQASPDLSSYAPLAGADFTGPVSLNGNPVITEAQKNVLGGVAAIDSEGKVADSVIPLNIPLVPRKLSYGPRVGVRTLRRAVTLCDTIHEQIVGYAAGATGGFGRTKFLVDNESMDPAVANSFPNALLLAKAAGGGIIHFDTRGHFNLPVDYVQRFDFSNLTIIAPGRNVTFWTPPLEGGTLYMGTNIITAFIEFRTMPGTLAVYDSSSGTKFERKLVSVDPVTCDMVAFIGCEYRHSSDGAIDVASSAFKVTSSQCRVTIQDFIVWDTDQAMLFGSNDATQASETAPPGIKVTLHNGIYAYCGERQPKVGALATADASNIYTLTLPFQRDQVDAAVNEFSICYGMEALGGGSVRARGCLWETADGVAGYNAIVSEATNGVVGGVDAIDSVAVGMNMVPVRVDLIPELPYVLPHTPVPPAGPDRDAWVAERWRTCGAGVDAAPRGEFVWTDDTSFYPNGETVLVDRDLGFDAGRWLRVDTQSDFVKDGTGDLADPVDNTLDLPRGNTVTIQAGAIDIDPDNSLITIVPETGDVDDLLTLNGGVEGRVVSLKSLVGDTITLKPGGNIDITENIVIDRRARICSLIYVSGAWSIFCSNERVTAATQAALDTKMTVYNGTGSWAGFKMSDQLGVGYNNPNTGTKVGIFTNSAMGAIYGENATATQWFNIAGDLNGNSRIPIDGSHSYEFTQPVYGPSLNGVELKSYAATSLAVGTDALDVSTGAGNVAVGASAGKLAAAAANNTLIGWNTGANLTTGNNNTVIGANMALPSGTSTGVVIVGDGAGNKRFEYDGTNAKVDGQIIKSGTYSPVLTGLSNTTSVGAAIGRYSRVGNVVTVSVQIEHTAAALADTSVQIELPIASDIGVAGDVGGTGASSDAVSIAFGPVYGAPSVNGAIYRFKATVTQMRNHFITFQYTVI